MENLSLLCENYEDCALFESIEDLKIAAVAFETQSGIIITNGHGIILRVNHSFSQMMGYRNDEVVHQHIRMFQSPIHGHLFFQNIKQVLMTCDTWQGRIVYQRKDCSPNPYDVSITAVRNWAHVITHYVGTYLDIAEREQFDLTLRDSEERYRALVECSPAAILVHNHEHLLFANQAVFTLTGVHSFDELCSLGLCTVLHEHELKTADNLDYEATITHARGHSIPVEIQSTPIVYDGQEARRVTILDVSERKRLSDLVDENMSKYKGLSEASFESVFITHKGFIIEQNARAFEMFGYTVEDVVGQPGALMIVPEHRDSVMAYMISEDTHPHESKGLRKDGTTFPVMLRRKIMSYQGKTVRVTSVTDITDIKKTEQRFLESEARLRAIIDSEPEGVKIYKQDGSIIQINKAGLDILEAPSLEAIEHLDLSSLIVPADRPRFKALHDKVIRGEQGTLEFELIGLQGARKWLDTHAVPIVVDGETMHLGVTRDITHRKQTEATLRIAAIAFESIQGMVVTDAERNILQVNRSFTKITGYTEDEVIGKTPKILSSGKHDRYFYQTLNATLDREGTWHGEIWNKKKNGTIYPEHLTISAVLNDDGVITNYIGVCTDLTDRKKTEAHINTLEFYDSLTDLPNRRLLLDRLAKTQAVSLRSLKRSALLFIDLDNFKTINDTLGHAVGDMLLQQAAKRISSCIREGDTVSRIGSDNFVVMLDDLHHCDVEAATIAESAGKKILNSLHKAYKLDTHVHHGTASIGITLFGTVVENITEPLKRAELAMYKAKDDGRNTLRFFDQKMQDEVTTRASLEKDLREAIKKHQFKLYYQAQVVGEGRIIGVESLIRWFHPTRGMVSPAEFIPLAEDTGLIISLGHWILKTACEQLVTWSKNPLTRHLTIAVNVSAKQFKQADFVEEVTNFVHLSRANPKLLKLELTESLMVSNVEDIITKMSALKALGIGFSLDDFGTGYSSLSYLKRLPLDQLKIDQGFIRNILHDTNDAAIAKMVVALADSLGLAVIAEGVELVSQRDFLAKLGCHAYQGYLFSKPLPVLEFEQLLSKSVS